MTMQQHLDDGCKTCAAKLETWQSVLAVAGAEISLEPPADVVRLVKSFAVAPKASPGVRLVFDSMLQPATAGVRGSLSARQLLYQTDEYYIDLRLEPRREADRACLVGQVVNRAKDKDRLAQGISVSLKTGNLPLAETTVNQYGEFQFEFATASDLCISIIRDQASDIVLPLYDAPAKSLKQKPLD
jgi:hypothetical protein